MSVSHTHSIIQRSGNPLPSSPPLSIPLPINLLRGHPSTSYHLNLRFSHTHLSIANPAIQFHLWSQFDQSYLLREYSCGKISLSKECLLDMKWIICLTSPDSFPILNKKDEEEASLCTNGEKL